jgi:signal transduction histidine kinase
MPSARSKIESSPISAVRGSRRLLPRAALGIACRAAYGADRRDVLAGSATGKIETSFGPICVDKSEFALALVNIALNARDAMPMGGHLSIRCENFRSDREPITAKTTILVRSSQPFAGPVPRRQRKRNRCGCAQ